MKTLILCILVLTIASVSSAQNVNIPDANFKNALIEAGVDTDKDGEISYAEAEAVNTINVRSKYISNMMGIEAFTNLNTLDCRGNLLTKLDVSGCNNLTYIDCAGNQLTSLDVSNNTALEELYCSSNGLTSLNVAGCNNLKLLECGRGFFGLNYLTSLDLSDNIALTNLNVDWNNLNSLDVSNNTALEVLYCGSNGLTSLDVSKNIDLKHLTCTHNQLTSLDVSNNTALAYLSCGYNQLTCLDVSNNTALEELWIGGVSTLYEVCVWEDFSPDSIYVFTKSSPNVNFTTDCAVNIPGEYAANCTVNIYPNPSNDIFNIEIENINNATIEIYDVRGKQVLSKAINSKDEKIDVAGFLKGIYIVRLMHDTGINTGKVVVR